MTHLPISLKQVSLYFNEKCCFEEFSARIIAGQRIAITGANGSGKTMLLKIIQGLYEPSKGQVECLKPVRFGYVAQTYQDYAGLSGGESFNKKLSQELAQAPDILCLDEPTNHLDKQKRRSLMGLLKKFEGTLIIISHDIELLRTFDILWHIEDGRIYQFSGSYEEFLHELSRKHQSQEVHKERLRRDKLSAHRDLMREQVRAKKKRIHGEKKYDGDKLALRSAQGRGQRTSNKNNKRIGQEKDSILHELLSLKLPEIIKLQFSLSARPTKYNKEVLNIIEGSCGYQKKILEHINFQLSARDRIAIVGPNASGKSTLVKAIMADPSVKRSGSWVVPDIYEIGYLDQHYRTLIFKNTVLENIQFKAAHWSVQKCREHLNSFLFRSNDEVQTLAALLSGGEKARLSLAQIAINTPRLLILDEMTNNLDLKTREHVIQVLNSFPGALVVISHDEDFLERIGIMRFFELS